MTTWSAVRPVAGTALLRSERTRPRERADRSRGGPRSAGTPRTRPPVAVPRRAPGASARLDAPRRRGFDRRPASNASSGYRACSDRLIAATPNESPAARRTGRRRTGFPIWIYPPAEAGDGRRRESPQTRVRHGFAGRATPGSNRRPADYESAGNPCKVPLVPVQLRLLSAAQTPLA
jgi:hypothetical protein